MAGRVRLLIEGARAEMRKIPLKQLALSFCAIGISGAAFWLWERAIPSLIAGEFGSYSALLLPLGGLVISGALFTLMAFFVQSAAVRIPAAAAIAGILFAFFAEWTGRT